MQIVKISSIKNIIYFYSDLNIKRLNEVKIRIQFMRGLLITYFRITFILLSKFPYIDHGFMIRRSITFFTH